MRLEDFSYELPPAAIAQFPPERRRDSRLLNVTAGAGETKDLRFPDVAYLLRPNDLLVVNDTRVLPARLFASRPSGGRVEIMLERLLDARRILAQTRSSKPLRSGQLMLLEDGSEVRVVERRGGFKVLEFPADSDLQGLFEQFGHIPLPPYIERSDEALDRERYQTVYAHQPGAVAAPTAGLHFDQELLQQLDRSGVQRTSVTLHVGAGTFKPVRCEEIEQHQMHQEWVQVSEEVCNAVEVAREKGGRVVAAGTTVVRALESAVRNGRIAPLQGDTALFIYPGYRFQVVDALITNFHLPRSTLLMMVCAFAGRERVLAAYHHAVESGYRFFSYGDAMFLDRSQP